MSVLISDGFLCPNIPLVSSSNGFVCRTHVRAGSNRCDCILKPHALIRVWYCTIGDPYPELFFSLFSDLFYKDDWSICSHSFLEIWVYE